MTSAEMKVIGLYEAASNKSQLIEATEYARFHVYSDNSFV